MTASRSEITLQVARDLLRHLPDPLHAQLQTLLERADKGENVTISIVKVLSAQDNIREWMKNEIAVRSGQGEGGNRIYGSLAGKPSSIPSSRAWYCSVDGCTESFPVIQEGEDAPLCDLHGKKMLRGN